MVEKVRTTKKWFFSLVVALCAVQLAACSSETEPINEPPSYNQPEEFPRPRPPAPVKVDSDWDPDKVTVECGDVKRCPAAHGLLLAIKKSPDPKQKPVLNRCTAFLYDNNKIMTAGHCADIVEKADRAYFRTVAAAGMPSQTFNIKQLLAKNHNPTSSTALDFAAFEIEGQATNIELVRQPHALPADTSKMVAFVINRKAPAGETSFVLDAVDCEHSGKVHIHPFSYQQNPDTFLVNNCILVRGNSGGALVDASDLKTVLGITSGTLYNDVARFLSANFEKPKVASITNARCLSAPGWMQAAHGCFVTADPEHTLAAKNAVNDGLKEAYRKAFWDWYRSPNSFLTQQKTIIRFHPVPLEAAREFEEFHVFLPEPACFEGAELKTDFTQTIQVEEYVLEEDLITGFTMSRSAAVPFAMKGSKSFWGWYTLSLHQLGPNIWKSEALAEILPSIKRGYRSTLKRCKEGYQESYIEDMLKRLDGAGKTN
jgi:hypothetical protein